MVNIHHFPSMRQSIKLPIRNFINFRFLLTKKFTYLLHIKTFQRVAAIVILFSMCQKENIATKYDKFLRSEFINTLYLTSSILPIHYLNFWFICHSVT